MHSRSKLAVKLQNESIHDKLYAEVGHRIQKARKDRRITQAVLADHINLNRTSVTNIELGKQKMLLHTLFDIAAALNVSYLSLLPEDYEPQRPEVEYALNNAPESIALLIREAVANYRKDDDLGSPA